MDLAAFLGLRRAEWQRLEEMLRRVEGSGLRVLSNDEAVEFGRLYRRAASDLNQAQTYVSGEATVGYLNDLVARCSLVITAKRKGNLRAALGHLATGFPAAFRRHLGALALATAVFTLGTAFGFLASWFDGDLARACLLPRGMPMIQPDEDGSAEPALTGGELARFSSHLFTNNLGVSLLAFALGLTFGAGTAWLLLYNGVVLGALAAVFLEAGQVRAFATGVLPHGVIEIPACLIGGAAGFILARAMIQARPWPRKEELARAGREALLLVSGCVPLLAAAAVLEAGVARAPDWVLTSGLKLSVAAVVALAFAAYVLLLGWGRPAGPDAD